MLKEVCINIVKKRALHCLLYRIESHYGNIMKITFNLMDVVPMNLAVSMKVKKNLVHKNSYESIENVTQNTHFVCNERRRV